MTDRARRGLSLLLFALALIPGTATAYDKINSRRRVPTATPAAATITPGSSPISWDGNATGGAVPQGESSCMEGTTCDTFTLTLAGTVADWAGKSVRVTFTWLAPATDYDMYIHRTNNSGPVIRSSTGSAPGTTEGATITPAADGTGVFTVHAVYYTAAGDQYHATASIVTAPDVVVPPPLSPQWTINYHGTCCEGNMAASGPMRYVLLPVLDQGNKIERSADGGKTWVRKYPPADVSVPFGIEGDLNAWGDDVVFFGTELAAGVAAHSDNRGESWTVVQIPVAFAANDQAWSYLGPLSGLTPAQTEPYVLAGWYRIGTVVLFSFDGGLTWPIETPLPATGEDGSIHAVCEQLAHTPTSPGDTRIKDVNFFNKKAGVHGAWGTDRKFYWTEASGGSLYVCKTDNFGATWTGIKHPIASGPAGNYVVSHAAFDSKGTLYVLHGNKLYVSFNQGESFAHIHTLPRWGNALRSDTGHDQFFVVSCGTIHIGLMESGGGGKGHVHYLRGAGVDTPSPLWTDELVDVVDDNRVDFMQLVLDSNNIPTISYTTPDGEVTTASRNGAMTGGFDNACAPDLTLTLSHAGTFVQGQAGATYTISATNAGALASAGAVTVVETLPSGLTATAIGGSGWTCALPTLSCTRSDALAGFASYPPITVTVNVAPNAPAVVTNTAAISGGGQAFTGNDAATDATGITITVPLQEKGPSFNFSNAITFDHSTLNDPVRMVGEPDIQIDSTGALYVSGPGGSTTQTSWFWKSTDRGLQWHIIGCPEKSNCQNGGGDTEIVFGRNNDVFASDLQTLQCNSTLRSFDGGQTFTPGEGCFPETDRQWMGIYDPNGGANGRRIYLAANGDAQGCYMLVSTDNGVTYLPPNPMVDPTASLGGANCIGRFAVDPANGHIFVPMSGGTTRISADGGQTWISGGSNGARGNFFATIQMDTAGNLWQAWTEGSKAFLSYSTNRGLSWHTKTQVSTGPASPIGTSPALRQVLFPWLAVGDPGRVAVVFYGTTDSGNTGGYPGTSNALWHAYATFSTDAMSATPAFTQVQATEHPMHRGAICTGGFPDCLTANSDRSMADFFMVDKDPEGRVFIAYNENSDLSQVAPGEYIGKPINAVIRQRTGPSLFASKGNLLSDPAPSDITISSATAGGGTFTVSGTHGLPPGNWTTDAADDAPYPVIPVGGANHPALDILEVTPGDDGTDLTFKIKMSDLTETALADAVTAGGTPAWMVMWFSGKNGLGPTSVTSAPLHSHWFVKWLGQTAFVYGKVSSFDFLALGAPTPKFLTYVPLGTAHGSVNGNVVSINVPLSSVGLTAGDKIEHVTAYSLVEAPDPTLNDWADQSKTFSYVVGTPLASQHLADGYVQVSTDGFVTSQLATLNGANNTWIAPLTSVSSSTVCARQVLAKDLYTPVWDDVQAGPVACFALPLSPTTTSIESSSNPSSDGQAVTFTARVTFTEPGTPGGIVTFSSDGTAIGTGTLDGTARASFTTSALAIGTHAITAVYSGDANFAGSASLALTQTILAAPPLNITALGPDSVCQGGPDFMLTVDGGPFDAGSKVQLDGVPQETSFVGTTRVTALIHGSDIVTSGVKPVRVVDSTNNLSNIVFLSVTADGAAPVVTPPDAITVAQTICNATNGGATGSTSAALAAFLSGGSGVDACTATPARLTAQVSGADAGNATVFSAGTSTVTFRFRDNAGNVGVATSTVTVRAFGDLDETGDVTATDLVLLANYLVGNVTPGVAPFTAPLASSDVNGDAKIDAVDIVIVANYLVGNIDCLAR